MRVSPRFAIYAALLLPAGADTTFPPNFAGPAGCRPFWSAGARFPSRTLLRGNPFPLFKATVCWCEIRWFCWCEIPISHPPMRESLPALQSNRLLVRVCWCEIRWCVIPISHPPTRESLPALQSNRLLVRDSLVRDSHLAPSHAGIPSRSSKQPHPNPTTRTTPNPNLQNPAQLHPIRIPPDPKSQI
jgi:hypothetical protein